MIKIYFFALLLMLVPAFAQAQKENESAFAIPAATSYAEPDGNKTEIDENGVSGWSDPKQKIVFYGWVETPGIYTFGVRAKLPTHEISNLKLTLEGNEKTITLEGSDKPTETLFGEFTLKQKGYHTFTFTGVTKTGATFGDLTALLITGTKNPQSAFHFNLEPRRNAASVHLGYPTRKDAPITAFYNELTVREDPIATYYMACGFARGYFGIQVNSPTERRIIFSVWDSGKEAVDPGKVEAQDQIQLIEKGEGVFTDRFGNEGTGGHSHLVYNWKKGQTYRFYVTAQPSETHTIYAGYFFFPERKAWGLIARFRAPKDGGFLRNLYSFNENFDGFNGQKLRFAVFGNGWTREGADVWRELTEARFTHDPTGKVQRKDYDAGFLKDCFSLENGGFRSYGKRKYGDTFSRPFSRRKPPTDVKGLK